MNKSVSLIRLYLALSKASAPLAFLILKRRLKHGKEDPLRWQEKLGIASAPRPKGPLIWLHAVGVGEVLALPGFIAKLSEAKPEAEFLITTTARTAAVAISNNLPEKARHQYLPLDMQKFVCRFLDHWHPDLSIWAERDVWPSLIFETKRRGIPLAIVNGRMDQKSFEAKAKLKNFFPDIYNVFDLIDVQDEQSFEHFKKIGVSADRLSLSSSLKSSNLPLKDFPTQRQAWEAAFIGRKVWLAASTHEGDETHILAAHRKILESDPKCCLIIAPRDPTRAEGVVEQCKSIGLKAKTIQKGMPVSVSSEVYVETMIGQMGLWYRLATTVFVGGSLGPYGGHNPYEPFLLGCMVLHGPHVDNFLPDYQALGHYGAAQLMTSPEEIANAVLKPGTVKSESSRILELTAESAVELAQKLTGMMDKELA